MEKERRTRRPAHKPNVTTRRPPPPSFDPIEIWKQDQEHQKHEHDNDRSSPSSKSKNNKTENKNNTNNKTDSHNIDEDDDAYYWRSAIERLLQPEEDEEQKPQQPQNGVKSVVATDPIRGITTLVLPRAVAQVVSHSWKVIGHGLEVLHDHPALVSHVQPTDDTAHCTGYHDCAAAAVEQDNQENNNDDNDNKKKTINGKNNNNTKRGESSLSNRYNEFRRGLVLSDGACTCPRSAAISLSSSSSALSSSSSKATVEQEEQEAFLQTLDQSLVDLFWILHSILEQLLQALSWHWELPFTDLTTTTNGPGAGGGRGDHQHGSGCCCWFQNVLGPTRQHSQWHIKEYIVPPTSSHLEKQQKQQKQEPPTSPTTVPTTRTTNNNNTNNNNNCTSDGPQEQQHQQRPPEQEWLPAHTDPSLLSVILHDTTNEGTSGASGLQYYYQRQWHNVVTNTTTSSSSSSSSSSPHVVAVVMVGSILSTLTGGRIPPCRHRVMYSPESTHDRTQTTKRCRRHYHHCRRHLDIRLVIIVVVELLPYLDVRLQWHPCNEYRRHDLPPPDLIKMSNSNHSDNENNDPKYFKIG